MEKETETEKKKKKQGEKEVFQFYIYKLPIDRPAAFTGIEKIGILEKLEILNFQKNFDFWKFWGNGLLILLLLLLFTTIKNTTY